MLAFDVALPVLVNVPVKAPLLLNVKEFVTSPEIVPVDVNSPSFEILPVIPANEVNVPLFVIPAVIAEFDVKVPSFVMISAVIPPSFVTVTAEFALTLISPWVSTSSIVIVPFKFNKP